MAKQKRKTSSQQKPEAEQMPSVMDQVATRMAGESEETAVESAGQPTKADSPEQSTAAVRYHQLRIPMEAVDAPAFRLHLDISLQGDQAVAWRRFAAALDSNKATLSNGRRCTGINDAVRWISERIAELEKAS